MFCRSRVFILFFFFWLLCCLSYDLRLLVTPLVFSNFSYNIFRWLICFYWWSYCIYWYLGGALNTLVWLKLWVWIQLRRGVLDTSLYDKVSQWLATGQWFSPGIPVSSPNKNDHHITEILLKSTLNTLIQSTTNMRLLVDCNKPSWLLIWVRMIFVMSLLTLKETKLVNGSRSI